MSSSQNDSLHRIRHSLAHILAEAVLQIRPGSKLGFGPPIEDGFYYDFILSEPLKEEDFPEIEKRMRKLIQQNLKFEREELPKEQAFERLNQMGEPYKKEYAEELFQKHALKTLSFYKTGSFVDMCDGPHVESTKLLPSNAFKLRSLAGAYWRGDAKNPMMTRIYAWAFETKEQLDAHVAAYRLAQDRDHKKLGKELEIFHIDDSIGKGLPLWLPNGTVIRDELEKLMAELEFKGGYQRVATPHLAKSHLYYQTGHLPYFSVHMFPFMEVKEKPGSSEHSPTEDEKSDIKETYCLKPMNCPHHHKIFASKLRSYRELPLRLSEYGQVYRFEDSGALSGLLRVRGMCMNDGHIYCTADQIVDEFMSVMRLHEEVYRILGITDYKLRFSTWDPEDPTARDKYVWQPEQWEWSEKTIARAMAEHGIRYLEGKGEAAFYGPKIDFQFKSVTGREETASTCQLDFAMPERLNLSYIGPDNLEHRPYIIHRAPLGTHERFVAFLIEHYGGAFPTWLAPVQVRLITVSEKFNEYASALVKDLRAKFIRAELDPSSETMGKKIRNGTKQKIPNLFIIGEKEQTDKTVTWRRYGQELQKTLPAQDAVRVLGDMILARSDHPQN